MVMLFCQAMNRQALAKYVILRIKVHISMDFNYSKFGMYPLLWYALWNQKKSTLVWLIIVFFLIEKVPAEIPALLLCA